MRTPAHGPVLDAVTTAARRYLDSLPDRPVFPVVTPAEVRRAVVDELTVDGLPAEQVVAELDRAVEPFVAAHGSGRYFGFVIGGTHPAAWGADLLVSTWDQNAALYAPTPGVAVVEEIAARWLVELLNLPPQTSVGFVTGGQMANLTCLAAARGHVLRESGWDVEADGLPGAPRVNVLVKADGHSTVPRALRLLGLGMRNVLEVACDDEHRIDVVSLRETLQPLQGPTIICTEAGNINTGAFDPFEEIADLADAHRAAGHPTWTHVDGAIGLLAAASEAHRVLTRGLARLDSWSTDGHKLLNTPYDLGVAMTRHPAAHRAAMSVQASYLIQGGEDIRDPMDWNPEFSRRARGVVVYAVLRSLGRAGLARMIDRLADLARRFADQLRASDGCTVLNEVAFNQVLVRWVPPDDRDADRFNDQVMAAIQADATAFVSGTTWRGQRYMRLSVADQATDEQDVDRCVVAMLRCADEVRGAEA